MTSDALQILGVLFGPVWRLFTCFEIPGTHSTPAEWFFFVMFFNFLWRFLGRIFDTVIGAGSPDVKSAPEIPLSNRPWSNTALPSGKKR